MHNTIVVFVSMQQFSAKGEECSIRKAVIFQNDAHFFMLKEPGYRRRYSDGTSQILTSEQRLDFTIPIDLLQNDGACFNANLCFTRTILPWAIGGNVDSCRLYHAN